MRATYQGDTSVQRCDKCGRVLYKATPKRDLNNSFYYDVEEFLPYTTETVKKAIRDTCTGRTEHNVLEYMYYCNDCYMKGV